MNISPVSYLNFKNTNFLGKVSVATSNVYNNKISFRGNKELADRKAKETLEMLEYIDSKSQEVFRKVQMEKNKRIAESRPYANAFYSREDGKTDSYWFTGDRLEVTLGDKEYSGILRSTDEKFIFENGKLIEYRKNDRGASGYGFAGFSQAEVYYVVDKTTGEANIYFNQPEPFDKALKALRTWY